MKTHCEGLKTYEDLIARAFKLENTLFEKTSQLKELGLKLRQLRQANKKVKDLTGANKKLESASLSSIDLQQKS